MSRLKARALRLRRRLKKKIGLEALRELSPGADIEQAADEILDCLRRRRPKKGIDGVERK